MSEPSVSPCAACKYQRRKCSKDCIFAPVFPPEQQHIQNFESVYKIYGAKQLSTLLSELPPSVRKSTVTSLVHDAQFRHHDVTGCVEYISQLQQTLKYNQEQIQKLKQEASMYMGSNSPLMPGFFQHHPVDPFQLPGSGMYDLPPPIDAPGPSRANLSAIQRQQQQHHLHHHHHQLHPHYQQLQQKHHHQLLHPHHQQLQQQHHHHHHHQLHPHHQQLQQQHHHHHYHQLHPHYQQLQQQHHHQKSEIEGLSDMFGITKAAGQVTASGLIDLTEDESGIEGIIDGFDDKMIGQVTASKLIDLSETDKSETNGLIDGFENSGVNGHVTARGFINLLTEDENVDGLDNMGTAEDVTAYGFMDLLTEEKKFEPEVNIDEFENTEITGQASSTLPNLDSLTEEDMLFLMGLGPYDNSMYHMLDQEQQQQQQQQQQGQHIAELQGEEPLLVQPEQPAHQPNRDGEPNRDGVLEGRVHGGLPK